MLRPRTPVYARLDCSNHATSRLWSNSCAILAAAVNRRQVTCNLYTYVHTYIYIYAYIYIHMYACVPCMRLWKCVATLALPFMGRKYGLGDNGKCAIDSTDRSDRLRESALSAAALGRKYRYWQLCLIGHDVGGTQDKNVKSAQPHRGSCKVILHRYPTTITRTAATRTVAKKGIAGKTKMKIKQQNKKKEREENKGPERLGQPGIQKSSEVRTLPAGRRAVHWHSPSTSTGNGSGRAYRTRQPATWLVGCRLKREKWLNQRKCATRGV